MLKGQSTAPQSCLFDELNKFDVKKLPAYLTKNPIYSISEVHKSLLMIIKHKHLRDNRPL